MDLTYKTTKDFTSPIEARVLRFSVTQKQKLLRLSILLESDFAKMYTIGCVVVNYLSATIQILKAAKELKSNLKDLYINSTIQVDAYGSKKAAVIHVPYRLRKAYRKILVRLVRELEKKFST
ncbi:hypothetical protein DVH24_009831 [Malus domestica]|uniref:40S ribosomal protein S7 n=1 Tax=Malus domestica TaxID=3750 RepID=A0A498KHN3_MALDO|nr:hypothetical protein DVH24_009831 [Malus domestica]